MKAIMNLVVIILGVGNSLYKSLVFMLFFNWFVATTFSLPAIGYWLSFALIMTVGVLRLKGVNKSLFHYENKKMKEEEKWSANIANAIGVFLALNIALFIGWLIQLNIY